MQLYENKAVSGAQFDVQTVLFKRYYSPHQLFFLPFPAFIKFLWKLFTISPIELSQLFNLFDISQLCFLIICREFDWATRIVGISLNGLQIEQFANWTIFNLVCTKYSLAFFSSNKSQSGSKGKPIWTILSFSWIKGRRSKTVKCVWFVFHQC